MISDILTAWYWIALVQICLATELLAVGLAVAILSKRRTDKPPMFMPPNEGGGIIDQPP
jgi:hypothetical protein